MMTPLISQGKTASKQWLNIRRMGTVGWALSELGGDFRVPPAC